MQLALYNACGDGNGGPRLVQTAIGLHALRALSKIKRPAITAHYNQPFFARCR